MKKTFFSLLLIFALLFTLSSALVSCDDNDNAQNGDDDSDGSNPTVTEPEFASPEIDENGIIYTLYDDRCSVTGYSAPTDASDVTLIIPSHYKGLPVTSIGYRPFSSSTSPNYTITKIVLPDTVTLLCTSAFANCRALTDLVIPSSVTEIDKDAFSRCYSLESITIPSSVTKLGETVFDNCTALKSITVEDESTVYRSINGSLYTKDGKTLIRYAIGNTDSEYTVSDNVEKIDVAAFQGSKYLRKVTVPQSVKYIGRFCFKDCDNLTHLVFLNTNGWWYSSRSDAVTGTSVASSTVAKPAEMASLFTKVATASIGLYNYFKCS